MMMGPVLLGIFAGIVGFTCALVAGFSLLAALLVYCAVGTAGVLLSAAILLDGPFWRGETSGQRLQMAD